MAKITAKEFWKRFKSKKDKLMDIDSLKENEIDSLMNEVDKDLKEYSSGLDFILGDLNEKGRTITFTANDDEEYFSDVETLCENSPLIDFWQVESFVAPQGKNAEVESEDGKKRIRSKDLFFIPMESDEKTDKIGLTIGIKGYKEDDQEMTFLLYSLVEKMIGEYNTVKMIAYFDVCPLPSNPKQEGFLPLTQLPDFVQWKIEKMKKEK